MVAETSAPGRPLATARTMQLRSLDGGTPVSLRQCASLHSRGSMRSSCVAQVAMVEGVAVMDRRLLSRRSSLACHASLCRTSARSTRANVGRRSRRKELPARMPGIQGSRRTRHSTQRQTCCTAWTRSHGSPQGSRRLLHSSAWCTSCQTTLALLAPLAAVRLVGAD